MITTARHMLTCHWSGRRLQRYLDSDPAAPLTPGEVARLEAHLSICERCTRAVGHYGSLRRALSRWSGAAVDPASVDRVRGFLDTLTHEDTP